MNLSIMSKLIWSGIAALILFVQTVMISQFLSKRQNLEIHKHRRIIVAIRDILSAVFFVLFIILWYPQLKTVATTLAVIAVALVIATKEYILNITGFFHRSSARILGIGDRIEVDDYRGDVIDATLAGVTVLETGKGTNQYTGKTIFIPNSVFLSKIFKNETRMRQYVFHNISFPLTESDNWQHAEQLLLEIAGEVTAGYIDDVRRYLKKITRRHSLDDVPAVGPRIYIQMPEAGQIILVLRLPVPIQRRGRIEQQVVREYMMRKNTEKEL